MNPLLENRRNNTEPRCANCGWWNGRATSAGRCDRHTITTLDLAVCTDWRDGDPLQEVLSPDAA